MAKDKIHYKRCPTCGKLFKALTEAQISQNYASHKTSCETKAREKRIKLKSKRR